MQLLQPMRIGLTRKGLGQASRRLAEQLQCRGAGRQPRDSHLLQARQQTLNPQATHPAAPSKAMGRDMQERHATMSLRVSMAAKGDLSSHRGKGEGVGVPWA